VSLASAADRSLPRWPNEASWLNRIPRKQEWRTTSKTSSRIFSHHSQCTDWYPDDNFKELREAFAPGYITKHDDDRCVHHAIAMMLISHRRYQHTGVTALKMGKETSLMAGALSEDVQLRAITRTCPKRKETFATKNAAQMSQCRNLGCITPRATLPSKPMNLVRSLMTG